MPSTIHAAPRAHFWLLTLAALALGSGGCLNYEKQIIVFHFPKDGKEMRVLFVYEGLFEQYNSPKGGGPQTKESEAESLAKAVTELGEMVRGEVIVVGHPLYRFPVKLKEKEKENLTAAQAEFVKLLEQKSLKVEPGQFLEVNGKLSYCQPVTLKDPQAMVAAINRMVSESITMNFTPPANMDEETARLIKQHARDGTPWGRYEQGRLSVSIPGSTKYFRGLREHALKEFDIGKKLMQDIDAVDNNDASARRAARDRLQESIMMLERFVHIAVETPVSFEQRHNQVTIAVGWGNNEPFQIAGFPHVPNKPSMPAQDKLLHERARKMGAPVRSDLSIAEVVRDFQRTGVLPKQP